MLLVVDSEVEHSVDLVLLVLESTGCSDTPAAVPSVRVESCLLLLKVVEILAQVVPEDPAVELLALKILVEMAVHPPLELPGSRYLPGSKYLFLFLFLCRTFHPSTPGTQLRRRILGFLGVHTQCPTSWC